MKRIISITCCLAMLLTLLSGNVLAVRTYVTSDAGTDFIQQFEGYQEFPYRDELGNYYIGYGTKCDPEEYAVGVSEEEAFQLLKESLKQHEDSVNQLLLQYSIDVSQQQFDAMVSLTYTVGEQWINPNYRFCSYLINGIENYTEQEVVNAIATWCHRGNNVLEGLAQRRLQEAYLFLYGEYENNGENEYTYIHFDAKGGKVENSTVFYRVGLPYGELPKAESDDRSFLYWYTEDGTQLTGTEIAQQPMDVSARWVGDGNTAGTEDYSNWVNPYSDVIEKDWFYSYVRELSARAVIGGYPDGTFQPLNELKTGEALKLILLAAGYAEQIPMDRHWASGYYELAKQLGCFTEGETVDLEAPVTRANVARITTKALGLAERSGKTPFEDVDSSETLTMYEEGILTGTIVGGKRFFYPNDNIIRSEVCAVVSRVSKWKYQVKNDPAVSGVIQYRDKEYPVLPDVAVCPYDKNLFVLDSGSMTMYYNDERYTTALGIDVSSHQGEVDWSAVASSGIEFVMLRVGFRGYGQEGTMNPDKYFQQNLAGAKAAGLKVGVYFFSQAITVAEAEEEAAFVLEQLSGVSLEYPVVYDWEPVQSSAARTNGLGAEILTNCAIAFCDTISYAGYTPMLYYNLPVGYARYDLSRLTAYDVWFAQYASMPTMYYDYRIWQYTDSGKVPGIETKVDMNIAMIPY